MRNEQQNSIIMRSPNLLNICVDEKKQGDISGRLYSCYNKEAILFSNIMELIKAMEKLFDAISFPQASTKTRTFIEHAPETKKRKAMLEKVKEQAEVIQYTGKKGTFVTNVKFRQESTWQGEFVWMENREVKHFLNMLDFIKQIDAALSQKNV